MRLPIYIAKRYLFAKKSRNAINVISAVSIAGVAVGTMALIIILSVFNGLEMLVTSIFNTCDPDIKITAAEGKTFVADTSKLRLLAKVNGVSCYSRAIEENALLKYNEKQLPATIKGVDNNYAEVTGIDSSMWDGKFILTSDGGRPYSVIGAGLAQNLGIRINFVEPLWIYVPDKNSSSTINPDEAFNNEYIFPAGIFQIEQEYDSKYLYVPLGFAQELIGAGNAISSLELKFSKGADEDEVQKAVSKIFGAGFVVQNKYQQQEIFYKVMRSERFAIFMILTLIIIIASFNIIGSLTMLIIEKKRDIEILKSLGAGDNLIRKIFIFEGWLISIIGALIGLVLGFLVCWIQQEYGIVKLQGETLIVDSYPVVMKFRDFFVVTGTVLLIGFWAAWYPVRYLTKKYLLK